MATTKKTKVTEDYRTMDAKALQAKIAELRSGLVEHHKANAAQELPSTAVIRKTRREIAKALTILRQSQQQAKAAQPEVKEQEK